MREATLLIGCCAMVFMTLVFFLSRAMKRLDIVDIAWGGIFIVIATISFMMGGRGLLQGLATLLVTIWGLRLVIFVYRRFKRSTAEDPRYAAMRKIWKKFPLLQAYIRIFFVQALLALIIAAPVIFINLSPAMAPGWAVLAGVTVWLIGFLFESVGDAQLRRHLLNPTKKGQLMTTGLWRYTRHPNYFGEAMQWWGVFMLTLSLPSGWLTVVSPLLITFLLLFVSGVPLTEKRFEGRPDWNEYKKRTSVFIPLLPKVKK